jgi:NAD(P)-dependent dehydrogenase (short-subunit alcohol dehydrogenase family)
VTFCSLHEYLVVHTQVRWANGHVDILVNNAGVALLDPLTKMDAAAFDKVMAVNTRAPFLMAQAVAPGMIEKAKGKIINITSQVWPRTVHSVAAQPPWCAHLRQSRICTLRATLPHPSSGWNDWAC